MNDELRMIVHAVARVLERDDLKKSVGQLEDLSTSLVLWDRLTEIGLPRLLLSESNGGSGMGFEVAAAVAQELGRHAASVPMVDAMLANLWKVESNATFRPIDGLDTGLISAFRLHCEAPEQAWWRARAALLTAALMSGAMQAALDLTQQYTADRQQFGKPLAAFQAVQHQLAAMVGQVAACGVAVQAGARELDETGNLLPAAIAKARTSDLVRPIVATAHQLHGAMGFTQEYRLQEYTKCLLAWRDQYGNELNWHEWLGRQALRAGGTGTWALIAADDSANRIPQA